MASFDSVADWMWSQDDAEAALVTLALSLDAASFGSRLSAREKGLISAPMRSEISVPPAIKRATIAAHGHGIDPLGTLFCSVRSPRTRRDAGAVYTPADLVAPMSEWALDREPSRVVDPGCGSGRFVLDIARRRPKMALVAVDLDPVATLMTRAGLAMQRNSNAIVLNSDFTRVRLPAHQGVTAFLGNPPYVRHHSLSVATKAWAQDAATRLGLSMSGLAGLHAYFFLAVALKAHPGDVGCFVTSAEWLDVNYGSVIRDLLLGHLGGDSIHVLAPDSKPFGDTATTAAVTCFAVKTQPPAIRFRPVATLPDLDPLAENGEPVLRARLVEVSRWSTFVRTRNVVPDGYVELGELCRVHRGAVTGSNRTWIAAIGQSGLPDSVLTPTVTRARELFAAGTELADSQALRRIVDLPIDLGDLSDDDRAQVEKFLDAAKRAGVHKGYIAAHRAAWWSVGLRHPAPILATYMARRPPAFVRNTISARHINIAHGLYPREDLPQEALDRLAESLRHSITLAQGRTYAGGLTKFEPREMERLPVPTLELLMAR